jgi:hypothetical protein
MEAVQEKIDEEEKKVEAVKEEEDEEEKRGSKIDGSTQVRFFLFSSREG